MLFAIELRLYGGQIIAQFRWEKGNWEGLLVYELLHSFSIYVDGEADRANWRLNSCGPGQSQQYELPPPSLFPYFLPLTRPQQRRKHIFSQAASNWYCWALGTQSVVLALWKNACKAQQPAACHPLGHHRLFTTTRPVWSRTSYSLSELKKGGRKLHHTWMWPLPSLSSNSFTGRGQELNPIQSCNLSLGGLRSK